MSDSDGNKVSTKEPTSTNAPSWSVAKSHVGQCLCSSIRSIFAHQPSLGLEFSCIISPEVFCFVDCPWVDSHVCASRDSHPANISINRGNSTNHGHWRVDTHNFFAHSFEIRKTVNHIRINWNARGRTGQVRADFFAEFLLNVCMLRLGKELDAKCHGSC
jgi:hypothetical protein